MRTQVNDDQHFCRFPSQHPGPKPENLMLNQCFSPSLPNIQTFSRFSHLVFSLYSGPGPASLVPWSPVFLLSLHATYCHWIHPYTSIHGSILSSSFQPNSFIHEQVIFLVFALDTHSPLHSSPTLASSETLSPGLRSSGSCSPLL